jgi:hypothetical protein
MGERGASTGRRSASGDLRAPTSPLLPAAQMVGEGGEVLDASLREHSGRGDGDRRDEALNIPNFYDAESRALTERSGPVYAGANWGICCVR